MKYSWSRGAAQLHDQRQPIVVLDRPRLVDAVTGAAQKFILWFASAERQLRGRDLISFTIFSADEKQRHAEYRIFIPLGSESEVTPESRPIGRVLGVKRQIFANGIAGSEDGDETWRFTLVEDSGIGRTISLPRAEASALRGLILNNARRQWAAGDLMPMPTDVQTKGRDFEVVRVEIVAYDPTSLTAFVCYTSKTGNIVQINLSTANLMTLLAQLP